MAPAKKRVKRDQKTSNYVASSLKPKILAMPVDILLEIFYLLHPADLVYLTRTSKAFRSFLLDRTKCLRIWQNALGHIEDLPGCPSFISEPAYASLAFIPLCHGCGFSCETIQWRLRVRCCDICSKTLLARTQDCKKLLPEKLVKAGKELWVKLFPFEYYSGKPSRFLKADIQNFKEQYEGIQERDTLKDIINHRRVLTFEINAHASACYAWQERVEAVIRTEQDQIRRKRRKEIEDRLTALGWGHELKMVESGRYRHEFHGLAFFAKAAPIDTKEWKKIKHVLVKFIENHRTRRHLHILKEDYRSRFSSLSSICIQVSRDMIKVHGVKQVIPNTLDILFIPQVRELLEVDFDTDFNLKDVDAKLSSILPSLLVHWYDDMMAQFQACVSRKKNDSGVDPFERAAQIFKCKQCLKALHRSDVIGHHCATDPMRMYSSDNVCLSKEKPNNAMEIDRGAVYTAVATDVFRQRPWTWEYLDVDPWRERIANLFEALGEDVTMATKKTMARCGLWVSCNYCRSPKGMQWQAALEHCIQSHLNVEDSDLTWTLLDSELKPEDGNKKKRR